MLATMRLLCLYSLLSWCGLALLSTAAAPNSDEIINLPGLDTQPSFKHYSGYLRASATRNLHYWFVESQSSPSTDPLVVWMNGGPGCSSLDGLLSEHGPYLATEHGDLEYNPYSWNKIANVLYLEAPAGVGFSYATDGNIQSDDDTTAQQNYNALMDFFQKYPQYLRNDFFISGESYAGIYVPTLGRQVMKNSTIRLKGLLVGNGLSSYVLNDNSLLYFAQYHGLLGETLWHQMLTDCCLGNDTEFCMFTQNSKSKCRSAVQNAINIIGYGLNIYNLYAPCYGGVPGSSEVSNSLSYPALKSSLKNARFGYLDAAGNLFRDIPSVKIERSLRGQLRAMQGLGLDPPCTNSTALSEYLNSPAVRKALHIPDNVQEWAICSDDVSSSYVRKYNDMYGVYRDLLAPQKYRILIYNGDTDMACNFLGDEWFFDSMKMELSEQRRPWVYADSSEGSRQVGGYTKSWKSGVVFATIRGAGHMVPTDKPQQAFHMFAQFLQGKPL